MLLISWGVASSAGEKTGQSRKVFSRLTCTYQWIIRIFGIWLRDQDNVGSFLDLQITTICTRPLSVDEDTASNICEGA